jgi:uncharacterized protein YaaR (DUF327 family)
MRVNFKSDTIHTDHNPEKSEVSSKSFEEHLVSAQDVMIQDFDKQLQLISEQGKRLCCKMSFSELKKYKDLISGFLKKCLDSGISCKKEKMSSQYGRTKILTIAKKIDVKLLQLAEAVMSENTDAMRILSLVDEIRGLLLDLYA